MSFSNYTKRFLPKEVKPEQEIIEQRRLASKTFDLGGNKRQTIIGLAPLHYKNNFEDKNEEWKEITLEIKEDQKGYYLEDALYNLRFYKDKVGYSYTSRKGGNVKVELKEINGQPVDNSQVQLNLGKNGVEYQGLVQNLEFRIEPYPAKVEVFKILKDKNTPKEFTWHIERETDGEAIHKKRIEGVDTSNAENSRQGKLELETEVKNRSEQNKVEDFDCIERWTGRVSRIADLETRRKVWKEDPVYPVEIDSTTSEDIVTKNANAEYNTSDASWNYGLVRWGSPTTGGKYTRKGYGAQAFKSVAIPQGATITSASWSGYVHDTSSPQGGIMKNYDADNVNTDIVNNWTKPVNIPVGSQTASVGPATTENVWMTAGITNVIQEIISRAGWSSNNNLGILQWPKVTGTANSTRVDDYHQDPDTAVSISITYSTGAEPTYRRRVIVGKMKNLIKLSSFIGLWIKNLLS